MKKLRKILFTLGLVGILFTSACSNAKTNKVAEIKTMSGKELSDIEADKEKKEKVLVIDVREKEEYDAGHLAHAINMPISSFKDNIGKIEEFKNKDVILYCNSGKKSAEAAKILIDNGFTSVTNADGVKQYEYELKTYSNILGKDLLEKKNEAFIVDVREAKDYEKAHFANAVNVSVDELEKLDSLLPEDKNALIITHCYSGNRSAKAAAYIKEKGYTNVYNSLDGTKEMDFDFN